MGFLSICKKISYAVRATAPGKATILRTSAPAGQVRSLEMYQTPGVASAPTADDRLVEAEIGSGKRVVIATHNYKVEVAVKAGETIIYSTDSVGQAISNQIKLDNAGNIAIGESDNQILVDSKGNIDLGGDARTFVTWTELNAALQLLMTALNSHTHKISPGASTLQPNTPLSIDISAANTATVRTR